MAKIYGRLACQTHVLESLQESGFGFFRSYDDAVRFRKSRYFRNQVARQKQLHTNDVSRILKCLNELHLFIKGERGETRTLSVLNHLSDEYTVINDFVVPVKTNQVDHLVVGPTGVFNVESKNWNAKTARKQHLSSPASQASKTGQEVWSFLESLSIPGLEVFNVVSTPRSYFSESDMRRDGFWTQHNTDSVPYYAVHDYLLENRGVELKSDSVTLITDFLLDSMRRRYPRRQYTQLHLRKTIPKPLRPRTPRPLKSGKTRPCYRCQETIYYTQTSQLCEECKTILRQKL